jgi:hypothetical protein
VTVDGGVEIDATGIDFTTVSEFSDIVALLNTAITGATVTESNGREKRHLPVFTHCLMLLNQAL